LAVKYSGLGFKGQRAGRKGQSAKGKYPPCANFHFCTLQPNPLRYVFRRASNAERRKPFPSTFHLSVLSFELSDLNFELATAGFIPKPTAPCPLLLAHALCPMRHAPFAEQPEIPDPDRFHTKLITFPNL
jgi:hypothetical protein